MKSADRGDAVRRNPQSLDARLAFLTAMGDEREQDARVVDAAAEELEDASPSRAGRVDIALGDGLYVHADAIAGMEHVRGRRQLDQVVDGAADRDGLVVGERVPGADDVALRVAPR